MLQKTCPHLRVSNVIVHLEPENGIAQHLIAAITGNATEHAPIQYIEKIFDAYADNFEEHLVQKLRYNSHHLLASYIVNYSKNDDRKLEVLDLGCGTGLVGKTFSSFASTLVGVDLSAKMLAKAAEKQIYTRLVQADLSAMMQGEVDASYDVIVAADVLIYSGDLVKIVNEVQRLLRSGGLFAFSVETMEALPDCGPCDQREYILTISGRYSHSRAYIEKLAANLDFKVHKMELATARVERRFNINAWHILWERC